MQCSECSHTAVQHPRPQRANKKMRSQTYLFCFWLCPRLCSKAMTGIWWPNCGPILSPEKRDDHNNISTYACTPAVTSLWIFYLPAGQSFLWIFKLSFFLFQFFLWISNFLSFLNFYCEFFICLQVSLSWRDVKSRILLSQKVLLAQSSPLCNFTESADMRTCKA